MRAVKDAVNKLQLDRIARVVVLCALQVGLPLGRGDGHKAFAAEGIDGSVRIGAVDEGGVGCEHYEKLQGRGEI